MSDSNSANHVLLARVPKLFVHAVLTDPGEGGRVRVKVRVRVRIRVRVRVRTRIRVGFRGRGRGRVYRSAGRSLGPDGSWRPSRARASHLRYQEDPLEKGRSPQRRRPARASD